MPTVLVTTPTGHIGLKQAIAGFGMSPSVVENYGEMIAGFAASRYEHPGEPRTAETTTPTEFGAWAGARGAAARVPRGGRAGVERAVLTRANRGGRRARRAV